MVHTIAKFLLANSVLAAGLANPIRRVVTLLQEMQTEISSELEKEKKMFDKFQCYCKKNKGGLEAKNEEAAAEVTKLKAEVEGLTGFKKSLAEDLKKAKQDRQQAKDTLAAATKKRNVDKAKYEAETKEERETIGAINSAVGSLEKGMGKSNNFLQADFSALKSEKMNAFLQAAADKPNNNLDLVQQQTLSAFLQGDYHSASGEIIGILKQMKVNIDEDLGGVISAEESAVKTFFAMKKAQQTIIDAASQSIEQKTEEKGKVAVKIVEGKNQISTLNKQLGDDQATLVELLEACKGKDVEFAQRQKDGQGEVVAIGQAIGILNNDDSLELFKKTDTKALVQLSLLQTSKTPIAQVRNQLTQLEKTANNPAVSMLAFSAKQALSASTGKVDFSKILKMIDDMAALLKKEEEDDLKSRDQCNVDLNENDKERTEIGHAIRGLEAGVEDHKSTIAEQISQIEKQIATVKASEEAQAEATKQRNAENADFVEAVQLNNEAVALITKAKEKLLAYYNPGLVKKEQRTETTEEAAARVSSSSLAQTSKLPGDTPEIFEGKRQNKGQTGQGVMALMDTISTDLNNDTNARKAAESTAQKEYEKLSLDLSTQVADAKKAESDARGIKANHEESLQTTESTLSMKQDEQANAEQTKVDLHAKCDFILNAFEERKSARQNEIAGLGKAKAILSGANFK